MIEGIQSVNTSISKTAKYMMCREQHLLLLAEGGLPSNKSDINVRLAVIGYWICIRYEQLRKLSSSPEEKTYIKLGGILN
ncbi:hypothetical protein TNCV_4884451 [Trichonephila clavipes]|nr:hypothetical protein TNCV_4884451 [Trichonephila clavipes]